MASASFDPTKRGFALPGTDADESDDATIRDGDGISNTISNPLDYSNRITLSVNP